ncbi:MAG: hypothetical protein NTX45_30080 [Proteobacteria bacterium]|nr:hypothetical protein [Pseudomonadota bacterium]
MKSHLLSTLFAGLFTLLQSVSPMAWAGFNQWTNTGPEGASIPSLAIDPSNPDILYAVTELKGIVKSTDHGGSWVMVNNGLPLGTVPVNIEKLTIDATNPSTLYVLTYLTQSGVYKSTDGGGHWISVSKGLMSAGYLWALAIDPSNPATLYVGTSDGVYKSTDGGGNWSAASNGLPGGVFALAIDPSNPATLYAGTEYNGVYKSTDGGGSWSAPSNGLTVEFVRVLTIDPSNPSTLYAGTAYNGVYKSSDGGGSWSEANVGLSASSVGFAGALVIDPSNPSTLYAGFWGAVGEGDGGLYKSTNGGGSWVMISAGGLPSRVNVGALVIDPSNLLYAGTDSGIYKSANGGGNWATAHTGLTAPHVGRLIIDPSNPTVFYTSVSFGGGIYALYKSGDGGASWTNLSLPTGLEIHYMVIDRSNPSTLYGIRYNEVYKSADGGKNWISVNELMSAGSIYDLVIDPSNSATLYAGTNDGVYKTTDGGGHWVAVKTGYTYPLVIDPANPTTLYAGTLIGVYKTTDGGGHWVAVNAGLPTEAYASALTIDPSNPATLYAAIGDKHGIDIMVYKSTNGGGIWVIASTGIPAGSDVYDLAVDPSNPAKLYAGTNVGVFKSANGGESWGAFSTGLTATGVHSLVIDPFNPNMLYAGTAFGGLFKYTSTPAPEATTGLATTTPSAATLNGMVNPNNSATTAQFEYGPTIAYGSMVSVTLTPNDGSTAQAVSAAISGLQPGMTYHYRITATNGQGMGIGSDAQFKAVTLPYSETGMATSITSTTATLNGTLNPNNSATTAQFEYGLTTAYGSTSGVTLSPNDGSTAQAVSVAISGLQPGMTYHYRITATNNQGTGIGIDAQFQTAILAECLFNWAEKNYPSLFAPAGSPTAVWDVYAYRHYSATNSYLGVSLIDNHVYYQGPDGELQDEGPLTDWLPKAGCQTTSPPPAECLFDWAEKNYPGLFSPPSYPTAVWDIYSYRYYSVTNSYLGVSSVDNHVYYMGADGKSQDEGSLSHWLPKAGCQ